ncbi:MAG: aminoglycoside 3-N-acetyltransferase [Blastocatellia bacterium]|nr:aminoglycoside 3-N-acetyltransferase [Blastocatellia bacterium]
MNELPIVSKSDIVRGLHQLGVAAGDTVMLHSSVKRIGWVVGGPQIVLEALFEVLSPSGTLLIFASFEDDPYHLDEWPEPRRQAYLNEFPPYDPLSSRADRKNMGILAEYLRTWPGAHRTTHPFSYVAVGASAQYLTKEHPLWYRDGFNSPLERLCRSNGRVLLLGAPLSTVTILHHAEFLAEVPHKRIARYRLPLLQNNQKVWVDIEEFDTSKGIVDWPEDYFVTIMEAYLAAKNSPQVMVGDAPAYYFSAIDLVGFGVQWMEEHFCGQVS